MLINSGARYRQKLPECSVWCLAGSGSDSARLPAASRSVSSPLQVTPVSYEPTVDPQHVRPLHASAGESGAGRPAPASGRHPIWRRLRLRRPAGPLLLLRRPVAAAR